MNMIALEHLARGWRRRLVWRDGLHAFGFTCLAGAAAAPWPGWRLPVPLAVFAVALAARLARSQPWKFDAQALALHLDRTRPEFEESSALWLRPPESLTLLERLQRQRIDDALGWIDPRDLAAPIPGFLRCAWRWAIAGMASLTIAGLWTAAYPLHLAAVHPAVAKPTAVPLPFSAPALPRLTAAECTVTPLAYTGKPERRADGFNVSAEESAAVTWRLALDRPAREVRLIFGSNDSLPMTAAAGGSRFEASRPVTETALYRVAGTLPNGSAWNPPEVYALKIIQDQPPTLRVLQPVEARAEIVPPESRATVEILAGDDYGVTGARLVATVAKGSGEGVKFREQTLPFDADAPAEGAAPHGRRFTKTLDLAALGMEPGDELYFHVEAADNRQPAANRARSETRFITLRGAGSRPAAAGRGGAGVNLVPQYFRSQRQIIIDTEKLLAVRPALAEAEFRQRANDLGADQQLLRLRYGQFLGEEMEAGQGAGDHQEIPLDPLQRAPSSLPANDPRAGARLALQLRTEHEQQDRGYSDEPGSGAPASDPGKPLDAAQVRAPFVDQHDSQDKATFFDHETKANLRDALNAMWQAEGFLRTARAQEALAPENRALAVLKELQQSARAYVQHVGFEPAPLKIPERRLRGDVADVPPRSALPSPPPPDDAALMSVRAALLALPWKGPQGSSLDETALAALRQAEPALTQAATRQPDVFLAGLQTLRRLLAAGSGPADAAALAPLERALLHLLPSPESHPEQRTEAAPSLAAPYFQALENRGAKP